MEIVGVKYRLGGVRRMSRLVWKDINSTQNMGKRKKSTTRVSSTPLIARRSRTLLMVVARSRRRGDGYAAPRALARSLSQFLMKTVESA